MVAIAMRRTALAIASLFVASASPALAQAPAGQTGDPAYALERGKLAVAAAISAHRITWEGLDTNGVKVQWYDDGDLAFIAGLRAGITRRFAAQVDFSITGYDNDELYWRPEEPHNPYAATGLLFTLSAGVRYDILKPGARVRPYVSGGLVAARYADVVRGPTEFCLDTACQQMAPELFSGTRLGWYFDGGVNLFVTPRWGFAVGVKLFPMPGSGTEPAVPLDRPTGMDSFLHSQLYAGIILHVR